MLLVNITNMNKFTKFWIDPLKCHIFITQGSESNLNKENYDIHSEKRFDWIKENYLYERLSLI